MTAKLVATLSLVAALGCSASAFAAVPVVVTNLPLPTKEVTRVKTHCVCFDSCKATYQVHADKRG